MKVTRDELRNMAVSKALWDIERVEHPTAFISDDLFSRILDDLHRLAAILDGQEGLF